MALEKTLAKTKQKAQPRPNHPPTLKYRLAHYRPTYTKRQGELAELAFLCDASHHGFDLSKPYGDNKRYDFLVDNGHTIHRLQVKSTAQQTSPGRYQVNAGRRLTLRAVPYTKSEIDFLAIYIRPEKLWFILPYKAFRGQVTLILYSPT